jgi:uncharacterized protein YbjT (DUF2867 family)
MEQSMNAKIFVTGGGGFVGTAVINELLKRGYDVVALVHRKPLPDYGGRVTSISGGLFEAPLQQAIVGCVAVIHLVGIIAEKGEGTFQRIHVEGTERVLVAAKMTGVDRYVQMSALGSRHDAVANYHRTKFAAEELVRASGLDWTIFQSSMIHGPGGEFMQWVAAWARGKKAPYLFMPYFGPGLFGLGPPRQIQPVYVGDVARAFVESLEKPVGVKQIFPLAGPERMTWPEFLHRCAIAITGHKKLALPIPAWYAKMLTRVVPARMLPFNRDQVIMSQEDNTADIGKFITDFGWQPTQMETALSGYAARL